MTLSPVSKNFRRITFICGWSVIALSALGLAGWVFDIALLRSPLPGFGDMKANTAFGLLLGGVALLSFSREKAETWNTILGFVAASLLTLLGAITVFEYIFQLNFGIDTWLFEDAPDARGTPYAGRMSAQTAFNFTVLGLSLGALRSRESRVVVYSQYLVLLTLITPIQALIGYLYGVQNLFGSGEFLLIRQMALLTALSTLFLAVGTLTAAGGQGLMRFVEDPSYAGATIRRLFLPALLGPVISGFFITWGFQAGFYSGGFALSMMALLNIIAYSFLIWIHADKMKRMEAAHHSVLSQAEEQVHRLQKMEAVGKLAGGVAHDFNNILAIIGMYGETMADDLGPSHPLYNSAEQVKKAVQRGATLTRQLLAFSRQQVIQPRAIHLNQVITDFKKMLDRLIGEDIELITSFEVGDDTILADQGQIEQVIMNLVVNARDALPRGGRIVISTKPVEIDATFGTQRLDLPPGRYVLLNVLDNGTGMSKETQERMFEPFFTTKEKGRGTGLGLSTVYGIVKKHQGAIWAFSELGHGTSFKVYLPATDTQPLSSLHGLEFADLGTSQARKVLIVEDDADLRDILVSHLKNHFTVYQACDGSEGLQKLRELKGDVDLVLMDIVMPKLSGVDMANAAILEWPSVNILFMSGYIGDRIRAYGYHENPNLHFIEKPFFGQELQKKILDVCAKSRTLNRDPA